MWECARALDGRLKEHLRVPSPIYDHGNTTKHHIGMDHFSIMSGKAHNITRAVTKT